MFGGGALASGIATLLAYPLAWHEVLAWFVAGAFFVGLPVLGAVAMGERGRNLVMQAHDLHDLMELDWRHFEELVAQVFRLQGWTVAQTQSEADGGADLVMNRGGQHALVQCKRWRSDIGVMQIRAFYGVMAAAKVKSGFFVTASSFHPEAERFARSVGVSLISGRELLRQMGLLRSGGPAPIADLDEPIPAVRDHDPLAPSLDPECQDCGAPMQRKRGRFGPFWGCTRYPDCKGSQPIDGALSPPPSN
jgi:restriction system protein